MPKPLLLLLFSLLLGAGGKSQCYIQLGEYSGFDTSPYLEGLDAAACDLARALPPEFRHQFRVYDFGFYSLNEYMAGGVDQLWQDVIRQAAQSTPYYLIFGKESSSRGIYSTIRVAVKLPAAEFFGCPQKINAAAIEYHLTTLLNPNNSPYAYAKKEADAMKYLIQLISCREICGNGIDDDGDGWSDCNDPDCAEAGGISLRSGPTCQAQAIFREHPEQKFGFMDDHSTLGNSIAKIGFNTGVSFMILETGVEDIVNVEFSPGLNFERLSYQATGVELLSGNFPISARETITILGRYPTKDAKIEVIDSTGIKIGELRLAVMTYEEMESFISKFIGFSDFQAKNSNGGNHYYSEKGELLYINKSQKNTDFIKIMNKYAYIRLIKRTRNNIPSFASEYLDQYFEKSSVIADKADITPNAWSKITTSILDRMTDVKIEELKYRMVHVKDLNRGTKEGTPFEGRWDLASTYIDEDGKIIISVYLYSGGCDSELNSVSNIQNCLGSHEYMGHAKLGYGDKTRNHFKCYELQFKHYSWKGTTQSFKDYHKNRYEEYLRNRN